MAVLPILPMTSVEVSLDYTAPAANQLPHILPTTAPAPGLNPDYDGGEEPLEPDHALDATVFLPVSHGFVLARIIENGHVLELRWMAFDYPGPHHSNGDTIDEALEVYTTLDQETALAPSRFRFPDRLVPSIALSEHAQSQSLHVVALTTAGYIFRLVFSAPAFFCAQAFPDHFSVDYPVAFLRGRTPTLVHGLDVDAVVIACEDGTLVKVEQSISNSHRDIYEVISEGPWREDEWRETTGWNLFSGGKGRAASQQVIAMATLAGPPINRTYTFSRDGKIRVWNNIPGQCTHAFALPRSPLDPQAIEEAIMPPSTLLPSEPRHLLRALLSSDDPDFSAYLVVFVPFTTSGRFQIYGIVEDARNKVTEPKLIGEQAGPAGFEADTLRDFSMAPIDPRRHRSQESAWILWTLWEQEGQTTIAYTESAQAGVETESMWTLAKCPDRPSGNAEYFEDLLTGAGAKSVSDVFTEFIFQPGRYAPSTISAAVGEYKSALLNESSERPLALGKEYSNIFAQVPAIVGCTIPLEFSPDTGAPLYDRFNRLLTGQWLRFVAMCNRSHVSAAQPLCLVTDIRRNAVFAISRNALIAPVVQDAVSAVSDLLDMDQDGVENFIRQSSSVAGRVYRQLASAKLRRNIFGLADVSARFKGSLSPEQAGALEAELLQKLCERLSMTVKDLAVELYNDFLEEDIDESARRALIVALREFPGSIKGMSQFYELLSSEDVLGNLGNGAQTAPTDLTTALLSISAAKAIDIRYTMTLRFTLLIIYIVAEIDPVEISSDDDDGDFDFVGLLGNCLSLLHTLHILRSATFQSVPDNLFDHKVQSEEDELLHQMTVLRVEDAESVNPTTPTFSLLNALTRRLVHYTASIPWFSDHASPYAITLAVRYTVQALNLLALKPMVVTLQGDVSFLLSILHIGLPAIAIDNCSFYPQDAALQYIVGKACLDLGQFDKAQMAFEKASVGAYPLDANSTLESNISYALEPEYRWNLLAFFGHLSHLFYERSAFIGAIHFATLAIDRLDAGDVLENIQAVSSELWERLFTSQLVLGRYEEAYQSLMNMPDRMLKAECTRRLVVGMCENGEVDAFLRMSFIGLEARVVEHLAKRALTRDPRHQPDYHRILYAYYIHRGDYKNAGGIMVKRAFRFAELELPHQDLEPARSCLQSRCESLLSAINTFSLCRREQAWVSVQIVDERELDRATKRRRIAEHVPLEEFNPTLANTFAFGLQDIRREYTLLMARLRLSSTFPELARASGSIGPDGAVLLYSQNGWLEEAFAAAEILEVDLSTVFTSLAAKCVRLSQRIYNDDEDDATWVLQTRESAPLHGSLSERAWHLLHRFLLRHDPKGFYHSQVLQAILLEDRNTALPLWLVSYFMAGPGIVQNDLGLPKFRQEHAPEILLSELLKFDLLGDALRFSLILVRTSIAEFSRYKSSTFSTVDRLPYPFLDQILAVELDPDPKGPDTYVLSQQRELRRVVEERARLASELSKGRLSHNRY